MEITAHGSSSVLVWGGICCDRGSPLIILSGTLNGPENIYAIDEHSLEWTARPTGASKSSASMDGDFSWTKGDSLASAR